MPDTPHNMSEANEPLEGELVEEDDIGFGEDDTDEFGEVAK